jgi:Rieske 2Fe-2S family protein
VSVWGIFGRPFLDLAGALDLGPLDAIDAEVARGLAHVETGYTGGTLKWMGVVAPWAMHDQYLDAMHVIEALPDAELASFLSLADDPTRFRVEDRTRYRFGDETDHPFNAAQQRWLAYRHGVYFPWKVCYHLLENERWEDKHSGEGKRFGDEAREVFPETVRYLESLPFSEIGRAVIFGLQPNDHAPLHRDSEPGQALQVAQSISLCPRANKRFFLQNEPAAEPLVVDARAYWFNDMDYHGVLADPHFRYSIRVDGVFSPGFVEKLRDSLSPLPPPPAAPEPARSRRGRRSPPPAAGDRPRQPRPRSRTRRS